MYSVSPVKIRFCLTYYSTDSGKMQVRRSVPHLSAVKLFYPYAASADIWL